MANPRRTCAIALLVAHSGALNSRPVKQDSLESTAGWLVKPSAVKGTAESFGAQLEYLHSCYDSGDSCWDCYLNLAVLPGEVKTAAQIRNAAAVEGAVDSTPFGRFAQLLPIVMVIGLGTTKMWQVFRNKVNEGATFSAIEFIELTTALCLYLVSGPAIILVNKHILKRYDFHFPILLASLGNVFLLLVTRGAVLFGFQNPDREKMGWHSYLTVVVPINICNFISQVAGMYTYLYISVPDIQILKSFVMVFVLVFAWLLANERVTWLLAGAVGVITMGVCVSAMGSSGSGAGQGTGHAILIGFILSMIAGAAEALKTVYSQIMMTKLSLFDGIYWSAPSFVALAAVFIGVIECKGLAQFDWSWSLSLNLILNALLTGVIILSTFWFVKLSGALTLKVVTQARSLGLILVSVFFFGETCGTFGYLGYAITLLGMGMFDHAKRNIQAEQAKCTNAK